MSFQHITPFDFTNPPSAQKESPASEVLREFRANLDKPQCNCGVVGVFNHPQAAVMTYYALHALQHRGQEAAGIVAANTSAEDGKTRFSGLGCFFRTRLAHRAATRYGGDWA
jgi:hypothetical protein